MYFCIVSMFKRIDRWIGMCYVCKVSYRSIHISLHLFFFLFFFWKIDPHLFLVTLRFSTSSSSHVKFNISLVAQNKTLFGRWCVFVYKLCHDVRESEIFSPPISSTPPFPQKNKDSVESPPFSSSS